MQCNSIICLMWSTLSLHCPLVLFTEFKGSFTYSECDRDVTFPLLFDITKCELSHRGPFPAMSQSWSLSVNRALGSNNNVHLLVFRKKDLYLIITQKLTFMKSGGFQVKSGRFRMDFMKSANFRWNLPDFTHEIRRISKDQLPGMVSPMFAVVNAWFFFKGWG